MIRVVRDRHENIESLLRRFKRKCNREGVSREVKRKTYYEKPTEKRRRKLRERERAIRKAENVRSKAAIKRAKKVRY
jgi:small subunit ribosomal protein S21